MLRKGQLLVVIQWVRGRRQLIFHWIGIRNSVFALHPGAGGSQSSMVASIINLWIIREGSSEEHGITINSAAVWSSSSVHLSSSLWEGGKPMVQSMGRISHEPVLKGKKKILFTSVTSNNISNYRMKAVAMTESQVFLNIAKVILFPMNLHVNTLQPKNCSVKKPAGSFQMLKIAEF